MMPVFTVILTFLEEVKAPVEEKLDMSKFSFKKAKKLLESYKGSLSDAIIEERRECRLKAFLDPFLSLKAH